MPANSLLYPIYEALLKSRFIILQATWYALRIRNFVMIHSHPCRGSVLMTVTAMVNVLTGDAAVFLGLAVNTAANVR